MSDHQSGEPGAVERQRIRIDAHPDNRPGAVYHQLSWSINGDPRGIESQPRRQRGDRVEPSQRDLMHQGRVLAVVDDPGPSSSLPVSGHDDRHRLIRFEPAIGPQQIGHTGALVQYRCT